MYAPARRWCRRRISPGPVLLADILLRSACRRNGAACPRGGVNQHTVLQLCPLCCQIGNFNTDLGRVFDGSIEGVKRHHVLTADDDCLVTGAQRHGIDLAAEGCRFRSESHNL